MNEQDVWRLEERFWLGGTDVYDELLSPECVMAFPAPAGIMKGANITRSLRGAPRWLSVTMAEQTIGRPEAETIVLAYRANGQRKGVGAYIAYCTSTYRLTGGRWNLVQHQQTPIAAGY
jgi:hypothetical protein